MLFGSRSCEVLTPDAIAQADARAYAAGVAPLALMDRAARACVRVIRGRWPRRPVTILCGPGQNGGDGWAIGWMLAQQGWPVTIHAAVAPMRMEGAAREAAERADIPPQSLREFAPGPDDLVIDALFGAGLSRPLQGVAQAAVEQLARSGADTLAVDLPSGVDGATGRVLGAAAPADTTVTFHARKPGHLLHPGAQLCGRVVVVDIGLETFGEGGDQADTTPAALHNDPSLWTLPQPAADTHKYARGAVVVLSGPAIAAGAARLAAMAAARGGAGAVTLASPLGALEVNAGHLDAIMLRPLPKDADLAALAAERRAAVVMGPGAGRTDVTRTRAEQVLRTDGPVVLDADALTVFEDEPDALFALTRQGVVLTPHEGEFARLFGASDDDKLTRAQAAAARAGCTVLLKGPDTVIATPGRVPVISTHAATWLATAGSGDCLAGLIGALLAQGMEAHDAACAGAWLHGAAGRAGGPGMTADDLPVLIGAALNGLPR